MRLNYQGIVNGTPCFFPFIFQILKNDNHENTQ